MSKRSSNRIPVRINIKYYHGRKSYSGTITNMSENGMYINTNGEDFPEDSEFRITIPSDEEDLSVYARMVRADNKKRGDIGMAVQLLNTPPKYIDFVEKLMYIL